MTARAPAQAIEDYTQAIAITSTNATFFTNRGNAFNALGDQAHAIEDYNGAIEIDPTIATVFLNRASVYSERRRRKCRSTSRGPGGIDEPCSSWSVRGLFGGNDPGIGGRTRARCAAAGIPESTRVSSRRAAANLRVARRGHPATYRGRPGGSVAPVDHWLDAFHAWLGQQGFVPKTSE